MICYRCQQEIKSGRVQKTRVYDESTSSLTTTSYCRHCYKAVIDEAKQVING